MNGKVGAKFSLWDGTIWGVNREIVPGKKLIQDWYSESENREWDKPTIVSFNLTARKSSTKVELTHKNVPAPNIKSINNGWKEYYLGPMKKYLESKNA